MNWRAIRAIVRKDLSVIRQSRAVMLPLIIVPTIMLVVLPALAALLPSFASAAELRQELGSFLANMPPGLQAELAGYDERQQSVYMAVVYFLAPLYLIVPLMVASVIAADSFVGEKERKTLEALLYTPTDDRELFVAKVLSSWLPALAVGLVGFVVYALVAVVAAWPVMQHVFFPNAMWVLLALWVGPAIAGVGLGTVVLVSSRVSTFQEAYQLGSTVVLPLLFLIVGQATGLMYFSLWLVALLGLGLWLIAATLLWLGAHTFRRAAIATRL